MNLQGMRMLFSLDVLKRIERAIGTVVKLTERREIRIREPANLGRNTSGSRTGRAMRRPFHKPVHTTVGDRRKTQALVQMQGQVEFLHMDASGLARRRRFGLSLIHI